MEEEEAIAKYHKVMLYSPFIATFRVNGMLVYLSTQLNKECTSGLKKIMLFHTCYCSEQLKSEWDEKKSLQQNMIDMGLTADANSILTVKKTKVYTFI